jgi:hypothetical protein
MTGWPDAQPDGRMAGCRARCWAGCASRARPRHSRFHPLVCTDNAGRDAGIVRMERLIDKLAAIAAHPISPI